MKFFTLTLLTPYLFLPLVAVGQEYCPNILEGKSFRDYRHLSLNTWQKIYGNAEEQFHAAGSETEKGERVRFATVATGVIAVFGMMAQNPTLSYLERAGLNDLAQLAWKKLIFEAQKESDVSVPSRSVKEFALKGMEKISQEAFWLLPPFWARGIFVGIKNYKIFSFISRFKKDRPLNLGENYALPSGAFRDEVLATVDVYLDVFHPKHIWRPIKASLRTAGIHLALALFCLHPSYLVQSGPFLTHAQVLRNAEAIFGFDPSQKRVSHILDQGFDPFPEKKRLTANWNVPPDQVQMRPIQSKSEFAQALRNSSQDDIVIVNVHGNSGTLAFPSGERLEVDDPIFDGIEMGENTYLIFLACRFGMQPEGMLVSDEAWIRFAQRLGAKRPVVVSTAILRSFVDVPIPLGLGMLRVATGFQEAIKGEWVTFWNWGRGQSPYFVQPDETIGLRIYDPATGQVSFFPLRPLRN